MNEYEKLKIKYAGLLGAYLGTLEGLEWWKLPDKLREKLKETKVELLKLHEEFDQN
jgi:hypothetical protein